MRRLRYAAIWLLCVFLCACGGGSGGAGGGSDASFRISLDRNSLTFQTTEGNSPPSQVVVGTWTGTPPDPLFISAVVEGSGIAPTIPVVITQTSATATVSVASGLVPGTYTGHINFLACRDAGCSQRTGGTPIVVAFTVTVSAAPSPAVTPAAPIGFDYTLGGSLPAARVLNVAAEAGAWNISGSQPWLRISPTSGSGAGSFSVGIEPAFVTQAGTLTGVFTVTSARGLQSIQVTVTAVAPASPTDLGELPDTQPPTAKILFPVVGAKSEADSIVVRGTASDDRGVASVTVNSVVAATTRDGFATWRATVPLSGGLIHVEVRDAAGNLNVVETGVLQTPVLLSPAGIVIDDFYARALVADRATGAIASVDLMFGGKTVFSNAQRGGGIQLVRPEDIVLDASRYLVVDSELDAVVSVHRDTGARSIFSDANTGTGAAILNPTGIAMDGPHGRALVACSGGVIAVDLTSGNRTSFGGAFSRPVSVAVDGQHNQALVLDSFPSAVIAVDLDTGARSVLTGGGAFTDWVQRIAVDRVNNRAIVLQHQDLTQATASHPVLVAVNLTSGASSVLSDDATPTLSNPFQRLGGLAVDEARGRALTTESLRGTIVAVNLANGARTTFESSSAAYPPNQLTGRAGGIDYDQPNNRVVVADRDYASVFAVNLDDGLSRLLPGGNVPTASNPFTSPFGVAVDSQNGRILVVDNTLGSILSVDQSSGARSVFATAATPAPTYVSPLNLVIDAGNNRILQSTNGPPAVLAVDLASGVRNVFSSASFPDSANTFENPIGLALDAAHSRLFVADNGGAQRRILSVNLATGARSVFSSTGIPNAANPLNNPMGAALDSARGRLLVIDAGLRALVAVSLSDGARTVLSSPTVPNAANAFTFPTGFAVDSERAVGFVADHGRVRVVDLITGERVFL